MPLDSLAWGGSYFDIMTPFFYFGLGLFYPLIHLSAYANQLAISFNWKDPQEGDYFFKNNYTWRTRLKTHLECYREIPRFNG